MSDLLRTLSDHSIRFFARDHSLCSRCAALSIAFNAETHVGRSTVWLNRARLCVPLTPKQVCLLKMDMHQNYDFAVISGNFVENCQDKMSPCQKVKQSDAWISKQAKSNILTFFAKMRYYIILIRLSAASASHYLG